MTPKEARRLQKLFESVEIGRPFPMFLYVEIAKVFQDIALRLEREANN